MSAIAWVRHKTAEYVDRRMPTSNTSLPPVSWERMNSGIEKVKARLRRACDALESAGLDYAVIGGNAVAAWVSRVDDSVVRNTRDVDLLVRRSDFGEIKTAMEAAGFIYKSASSLGRKGKIEMFLDGPGAKARDGVHILFANEKISDRCPLPSPGVEEIDLSEKQFCLLELKALVTMKLTSFRDKDKVHLRDMIEIGQIDSSWLEIVPSEVRDRLQELLEDPWG